VAGRRPDCGLGGLLSTMCPLKPIDFCDCRESSTDRDGSNSELLTKGIEFVLGPAGLDQCPTDAV
jgi:hypothetical protein